MNKNSPVENFVNARAVATYLQVHLTTVYDLAHRGDIPGYRFGRAWRFKLSEIEEYLFGDWRRRYGEIERSGRLEGQ